MLEGYGLLPLKILRKQLLQRTQKSKNNFAKEGQIWKTNTTQFQNLQQNYSNQATV